MLGGTLANTICRQLLEELPSTVRGVGQALVCKLPESKPGESKARRNYEERGDDELMATIVGFIVVVRIFSLNFAEVSSFAMHTRMRMMRTLPRSPSIAI